MYGGLANCYWQALIILENRISDGQKEVQDIFHAITTKEMKLKNSSPKEKDTRTTGKLFEAFTWTKNSCTTLRNAVIRLQKAEESCGKDKMQDPLLVDEKYSLSRWPKIWK